MTFLVLHSSIFHKAAKCHPSLRPHARFKWKGSISKLKWFLTELSMLGSFFDDLRWLPTYGLEAILCSVLSTPLYMAAEFIKASSKGQKKCLLERQKLQSQLTCLRRDIPFSFHNLLVGAKPETSSTHSRKESYKTISRKKQYLEATLLSITIVYTVKCGKNS